MWGVGVRKALLAPLPPRAGGGARGRTGSRSPASPERPRDVCACAPRGVGYPPPGCRHACSAPLADEGGGGDAGLREESDVHALPACAPWERGRAAGALASPALSRELAAGGDGAVGAAARRRGARAARGAQRGRRGTPRRWQRTGGRASSRSRSRAHARSCACADSGALHECSGRCDRARASLSLGGPLRERRACRRAPHLPHHTHTTTRGRAPARM